MKAVSYNIQYGVGMDGRFDPERIVQSIADADIIALQDVTRGFHKNGHADLAAQFADLFPAHFHVFAPSCDVLSEIVQENGRPRERRFQFGNMILSRWPILATRHLLLPRSRTLSHLNLQRGALEMIEPDFAHGPKSLPAWRNSTGVQVRAPHPALSENAPGGA